MLRLAPFLALSLFAQPKLEFIYDAGPTPSCHASSLVEVKPGEILATWFGGTDEGNPDVAIWGARRSAAGAWSKPEEWARDAKTPTWNPVLFYSKDQTLWLYYKFGPSPQTWTGARRLSRDGGATWSPMEILPSGVFGPIRAKPTMLPDGTLLAGSSRESYTTWSCHVERSADNARTWTPTAAIAPNGPSPRTATHGIIQPVLLHLGGNKVRLLARSTRGIGRVVASDSTDGGRTFGPTRNLDVKNPNAGFDAVKLKDGRFVLLYNDSDSRRTPLSLAVSRDGETWTKFLDIETEPGEFSYPAIIQLASGDLAFTYTWNRKKIRYGTLPLAQVR